MSVPTFEKKFSCQIQFDMCDKNSSNLYKDAYTDGWRHRDIVGNVNSIDYICSHVDVHVRVAPVIYGSGLVDYMELLLLGL